MQIRKLCSLAAVVIAAGCAESSKDNDQSLTGTPEVYQPAPSLDDGLLEDQPGDLNSNDPTGASASGVRKALGGSNGHGDYCDSGGCLAGEGDCDSTAQCATGNVCLTDNGGRYGPAFVIPNNFQNQQDDHCAPAYCNDFQPNSGPGEAGLDCGGPCGDCNPTCELPNHHADRATYHCPGATGVGDCDANNACVGWEIPDVNLRAICVADQGNRFGGPATSDYCMPAHCANRVLDLALGEGPLPDTGGACGAPNCANPAPGAECTPSCPCNAGGGDCDTNADCATGLVCTEAGAVDTCQNPVVPGGVLDDFNRPNSDNLGPNWTETEGNLVISSNRLAGTGGGFSQARWIGPGTFPYASTVFEADVFANPAGSGYSAIVFGLGGSANACVKIQGQVTPGQFSHFGFYGTGCSGAWTGGAGFGSLPAPFSAAHLTLTFSNGGDTVTAQLDTNFDNVTDHTLVSNGLNNISGGFGTGVGLRTWQASILDNFDAHP